MVRFFTITCRMSFDAGEFFHHRVQIDQYIVYVGMLAAILYLLIKDALSDETTGSLLQRTLKRYFLRIQVVTFILALLSCTAFWYYVQTHIKSQSEWTALQPFITPIPILAFLILRNAHPLLRAFHSTAFAWLGRYSGEMYVMQDHLFLSGDQEAVLRTGLFNGDETVANDRWRDLALITPLYLIICAVVGEATAAITAWLVKEGPVVVGGRPADAAEELPEVEMSLLLHEDKAQRIVEAASRSRMQRIFSNTMSARVTLWPRTVKYRLMTLLVAMWVLNLV
jgi:hypothetical protein